VRDPRIKAVGFTGSRAGGLALVAIAQARPEPIPVYAEMSSINPVLLLRSALAARAEDLGRGYVGSLTMGAGQFCTNPGVVLGLAGADLDRFTDAAAAALGDVAAQVMLTPAIHQSYESGHGALARHAAVTLVAQGREGTGCHQGRAAIFTESAADFMSDPALAHEVFGASSIIVRCADADEMRRAVAAMEGQLTITLHMSDDDADTARALLPTLERRAGRILANGWPTGVEVSHAMVHGGPFPATSDPRSTSVGATAIDRYLRPVCYQDMPAAVLPEMLRDENPYGMPRYVS